jgi:hypothetical protein
MKQETNDSEGYLPDPRTRKWIVQCVFCKRWGYRHDAPQDSLGRGQLEQHLGEMELDERGVCAAACRRCRIARRRLAQ